MAVKKLKPLADAGKLLVICEGNHELSAKKNFSYDITKEICGRLNVPYGGYSCFLRLVLKQKQDNTKRNVIIFLHHGWGSGRKSGGALNRREDMVSKFRADIFLCGHDHFKMGRRLARLGMSNSRPPKLVHKPIIVAATGSFMKSYIEGETTYTEKMCYPLNDVGVVRIDIRFAGENRRVDIHILE